MPTAADASSRVVLASKTPCEDGGRIERTKRGVSALKAVQVPDYGVISK
jgi:hypothetical protein